MSQLAEGQNADPFVNDINLITGVLDRLHAGLEDKDPLERLRIYSAVGKIAGGLLEVSELLEDSPELSEAVVMPRLASVGDLADEEKSELPVHTDESDIVEPEVSESMADVSEEAAEEPEEPAASTEQADEPDSEITRIKEYFSELTLTDREAALLYNLCLKSGEKARASDIYTGVKGTNSAIKQAAKKFMNKLADSPYGKYLEVTGIRAGTRYMWQGHGFEMAEQNAHELEATKQEPQELAHDDVIKLREEIVEPEDIVSRTLSTIGIDVQFGDENYLTVRGVPLKLTAFETRVLMRIAEHNCSTTFKELVTDKDLMDSKVADASKELSTALSAISAQLAVHGIKWYDARLPQNGKTVRKIELGVHASESSDKHTEPTFLAPGVA